MTAPTTVLVAGIGGASLGTEISKALALVGGYRVLGCDISELAYGHFDANFDQTFQADRENYVPSILNICAANDVKFVIPGGEQPAALLAKATAELKSAGVTVVQNTPDIVALCSDKAKCFAALAELDITLPQTREITDPAMARSFAQPCIVKPSRDSGGSAFVFFARSGDEAEMYCAYLLRNGLAPVLQSYIPADHGEFTVGVLSAPDGTVQGSIALRRSFSSKLSIAARGADFLISSGYSQGRIEDFPDVRAAACDIAKGLGSRGPLNIQGRIDAEGHFVPFEINPRFSASTYLRSLAGFHEVDHFVTLLKGRTPERPLTTTPGWYLRSLDQTAIGDKT